MNRNHDKDAAAVRSFALSLPGVHEDFPWGERVAKVGRKVFVFLGRDNEQKARASEKKREHVGEPGSLVISVKLPISRTAVLTRSFARPTDYGLGAKGWVTLAFGSTDLAPIEELKRWIEESYRAIAPKSLTKRLGSG